MGLQIIFESSAGCSSETIEFIQYAEVNLSRPTSSEFTEI